MSHTTVPPIRPEYENVLEPFTEAPVTRERQFSNILLNNEWIRKSLILAVLILGWEIFARLQDNDLLFPPFTAALKAFVEDIGNGELIAKIGISLKILLQGYLGGTVAALVLTTLAVSTRTGRDVLDILTSMFNPLPAIALLPLALLWFGIGQKSLVFVLAHSVLWPLALSMYSGFQSVPQTLRMAGRNYGLTGLPYVLHVLVPAALPAILSGLKIGWAFAWRTLIAAELVFGASSGNGGLGWYIFQHRNELMTDKVFAGLATVILIGLIVENFFFRTLERITVQRWGMQN